MAQADDWISLWRRLRRDAAGMVSLSTLVVIAALCFGSMLWLPHPYDAIYPDYILASPSLVPHPSQEELARGLAELSRRAHVEARLADTGGSTELVLSDNAAIDARALRILDHSDLLQVGGPAALSATGRRLVVPVRIKREIFAFGTDGNGRDLLSRILVAGRISLAVGALASAVALGIGVAYGAIAGYIGGRTDSLMMRLVDVVYALPFVFLVIVLLVLFGRSLWLVFLAIGAVEWLDMARIVRGQTLSLKRREFVLAAKALGVGGPRILLRHVVPNVSGSIVAYLALLVPRVILAESFLSFLSLGVQEPLTSWGVLIAEGARHVQDAQNLLIFPASALAVTVVAANQLGEALLRTLDRARI